MSMHLLPPYFNSNGNSKRKKKKKDTGLSSHDQWLLERGLHLSQLKKKKVVDKSWKQSYTNSMKVDRSTKEYDNKVFVAGSTAKTDIMTNLHKEPKHVQDAVLEKASRAMPLFNKGGLQLLSPKDDLKSVGTLSRR